MTMNTVIILECLVAAAAAPLVCQNLAKVWAPRFACLVVSTTLSHEMIILLLYNFVPRFSIGFLLEAGHPGQGVLLTASPIVLQILIWSQVVLALMLAVYHFLDFRYGCPRGWFRLWENIWYLLEQWAGALWLRFCPGESASYWLDWLPAFCARRRYAAQNRKISYSK